MILLFSQSDSSALRNVSEFLDYNCIICIFFIDLHNIVMRFNDAPTAGFEEDVGSKTTIRVINSQVRIKYVLRAAQQNRRGCIGVKATPNFPPPQSLNTIARSDCDACGASAHREQYQWILIKFEDQKVRFWVQ